LYSVTVLAVEGGAGTRGKGRKQRAARLALGRYCAECLKAAIWQVQGRQMASRFETGREARR
jgi:hypothetical protein